MDAFVRHKCETEILTIAKDLINAFGFNIQILSGMPTQGGFIEGWKLAGENEDECTLVASVISLVLSKVPPSNKALEKLQKENLKLEAKQKRSVIDKLKDELADGQKVTATLIQTAVAFFEADFKLIKHKSNFYLALQKYAAVEKISTNIFFDDVAIGKDKLVERQDFHRFILTSNKLPEQIIENAVIEVVSPVLKSGKYKWKGIFNDKAVGFTMKDEDYLKSVIKKEVTFQSGFSFQCILKINRIINDFGVIQVRSYTVLTVLGKMQGNTVIETEQGRRFKRSKEELENQLTLF
jgi:hypothetical protein